jgi:hypothetical protein
MLINCLQIPEGDTIGRDSVSGGAFFTRSDGTVWYRSIYGHEPMAVAPDTATFHSCADALNRYSSAVVKIDSNDNAGAMVFVRQLTQDLRDAGVLPAPPESFWAVIVEQAEDGML